MILFFLFPGYCISSYTSFGFRFVATIMHPAFNSSGASRHIQVGEDPATGHQSTLYSINVSRYLDIPPTKGEAIHGQSTAQVCSSRFLFSTHRAGLLEVLLNICSASITSIGHSMKFCQYFSDTHWSWMASKSLASRHGLRDTGIRNFHGRTTIKFPRSWRSACADLLWTE